MLSISRLIGEDVSAGAQEGITLNIPRVTNFRDLIESGFTVFVARSKA